MTDINSYSSKLVAKQHAYLIPEHAQAFNLPATDHGLLLLEDPHGSRLTAATTDIDFWHMFIEAPASALAGITLPTSKFSVYQHGWPDEWVDGRPELPEISVFSVELEVSRKDEHWFVCFHHAVLQWGSFAYGDSSDAGWLLFFGRANGELDIYRIGGSQEDVAGALAAAESYLDVELREWQEA